MKVQQTSTCVLVSVLQILTGAALAVSRLHLYRAIHLQQSIYTQSRFSPQHFIEITKKSKEQ